MREKGNRSDRSHDADYSQLPSLTVLAAGKGCDPNVSVYVRACVSVSVCVCDSRGRKG